MALERMVQHKRAEIAAREQARPLARYKGQLLRSDRSLKDALTRPGLRFIMEHKKASPSQGTIREDLTPADIVRAYGPVADAISVLTDQEFFGGSLDDLAAIRKQVCQPVLCKDIIVAPYQVYEARGYGADAVLLMLSVLSDADYAHCAAVARSLALDVITEVHNKEELQRALDHKAEIIGINNRDLKSLDVDLTTTERVSHLIPKGVVVVSESGITDEHDLRRVSSLSDAVLVGTSFMRAPDITLAARALVYGRIKVCGITRPEDALAADAAGAGFLGVNLSEISPRCVSLEKADDIRSTTTLPMVGVFVNHPPDTVANIARELNLAAVQLHGEETDAYIADLCRRLPDNCSIWKAVRTAGPIPARLPPADRWLFDTPHARLRGGTGRSFNWRGLTSSRVRHRALLAGGLNPQNAAVARATGCWALDVNSGIEQRPGHKDERQLRAFFECLRLPARHDIENPSLTMHTLEQDQSHDIKTAI